MDWKKSAAVAGIAVTLAGCASLAGDPARAQNTAGPAPSRPQKIVTDFSAGLRCMDDLMLRFGTRDVSTMLEEMTDKTGKLQAGTRDMMISAISDMTRRSRAVKLVAFGVDNANIVNFLTNLQKQNQFSLVPLYDIRGALTQFDTDAERRQSGFGVSILNLLGIRVGSDSTVSVLGFDASVIQTADLTVVPGVTSKNTVVIVREESGLREGSATINKVGFSFSSTFTRQDSQAQALRNMVELASIEVIGKLVKVPYWTCLDIPSDNPEIEREIDDWFVGLRNPRDMNTFLQEQLRNRDFYDGPMDGRTNEALRQAIAAYGKAIGARGDGRVDLAYFRDLLIKPVPAAPEEPFAVADLKPDRLGELKLELRTAEPRADEPLEVAVSSTTDAYVYCYTQSLSGKIQRFFPNRFARDPRISANETLTLPGKQKFTLRANASGDAHKLACLSAGREIYDNLPPPLRWSDFEDIGFTSFEDIRQAFANAAKAPVNMASLAVPLTGTAASGAGSAAAPVSVPVSPVAPAPLAPGASAVSGSPAPK